MLKNLNRLAVILCLIAFAISIWLTIDSGMKLKQANEINAGLMSKIGGYVVLDSSYKNLTDSTITNIYVSYSIDGNNNVIKEPFFKTTKRIKDVSQAWNLISQYKLNHK